jgi:D-alanyl-D-alanine carboxypeptidase
MTPRLVSSIVTTMLGVALLVAAGCSAPSTSSTPPASTLTTSPIAGAIATTGTTASSGLKPINQAALQAVVDATASELMVPGALVLLRTPQGEFVASYGTTKLGTTSPPRVDTDFRIASNTKTMTAAVILQLAEEGKVSLSDPISKYVQDVPNGDNITIAQLLDMRSGLYNYTEAPEMSASIDHDPTKVWTPHELLAIAFARPPNFAPGTSYEYCNTNYTLLGLVAERVAGKPLAQLMQHRLFEPLGLQHTVFPASTVNTLPEPYSHGYLYGSSAIALTDTATPYSPEERAAARAGTLLPTDYTNVNPSLAGAAGAVISNANDIATWIQALATGKVLNADYQRRWLDSFQPENRPDGQEYGYGIIRLRWDGNTILFHGGETVGYQSFIGHDLANKVTLVVWTNLTVSLDMKPTANALTLTVLDHIYAVSPLAPKASTAVSP